MSSSFRKINVPPFEKMMASEECMDKTQRIFFDKWLKGWDNGEPIPVDGNISYLFCYTYKALALPPKKTAEQLIRLKQAYPEEAKFLEYCDAWLSDCYVFQGDYSKALGAYPSIPMNSRSATMTDHLLSLKVEVGEHISGRDILTLNGPKVTKWGKDHLNDVASYIDVIVSALEKDMDADLLKTWKESSRKHPYSVYRGTPSSSSAAIDCYFFSGNDEVIDFIKSNTREAENTVREEMNIPRIGEGWIGETELYYAVCNAFPKVNVIQHARPEWLGQQHLDVFIPDYSVAIEYQGAQHDQPIEYFGGYEAYLATKRRDLAKKRKCSNNGIRLIEVRPGYDLSDLISQVNYNVKMGMRKSPKKT